jgi:hypothetical protein
MTDPLVSIDERVWRGLGIASAQPTIEFTVLLQDKLRGTIEVVIPPRQEIVNSGFREFARINAKCASPRFKPPGLFVVKLKGYRHMDTLLAFRPAWRPLFRTTRTCGEQAPFLHTSLRKRSRHVVRAGRRNSTTRSALSRDGLSRLQSRGLHPSESVQNR